MQQIVRMLGIEGDLIGIVRIRVNPYRVLTPFEHTSEDGGQGTGS